MLVIFMTLVAYQFALLTWTLIPVAKPVLLWKPVAANHNQNRDAINTLQLQQQHLFGETSKEIKPVVVETSITNAPKTRLNLTLAGIVAASDPQLSSAIIAYKGTQSSYFIDSKIDGTSAIIVQINHDRIILDVDGSHQTLMLDGVEKLDQQHQKHENKSQVGNNNKPKKAIKAEVKTVNLDRAELLKNPGKLTDYIRISPVRENGKVKGYRVKPGKDRALFEQAGLKNGDLAVELNGIDLTDTQQAFTLMKEFPTMTDMTLSVERDGQLHELYFSIP